MLKAIIFDMDGVLINSSGHIWNSFKKVFAKYGIDFKHMKNSKYLGRTLADQLKMLKEDHNIDIGLSPQEFSKESFEYQLKSMKNELNPNKYIHKLISQAKKQRIKIAVATSSSKKRAITFLKLIGLKDKLDALVTGEDVTQGKPAPDIFLKAAKSIKVQPQNCVVIEDALNGIQAAQAAKMKTVGRIGPHHSAKDFSIADMSFENFNEINIAQLENLFK